MIERAPDELGVIAYRTFIADRSWLVYSLLSGLPIGNYTEVAADGSLNHIVTLDPGQTTMEGLPLEFYKTYKVMVQSVVDPTLASYEYNYHVTEDPFHFSFTNPQWEAQNLTLSDISDTESGADLQISFDAAPDESEIVEYRVYASKGTPILEFEDVATATPELYRSITPDGGPYLTDLLGVQAIDDEWIGTENIYTVGVEYQCIVLSEWDVMGFPQYGLRYSSWGGTLGPDTWKPEINTVTLLPLEEKMTVEVTAPAQKQWVTEYRLMVSPDEMTLEEALAVPAGRYVPDLEPTGTIGSFPIDFPYSTPDVNGDRLEGEVLYKIYLLTFVDSEHGALSERRLETFDLPVLSAVEEIDLEWSALQQGNQLLVQADLMLDEVLLYDLQGKLLASSNSAFSHRFDLNGLPDGLYQLRISRGNQLLSRQIYLHPH